jgi:3D (Asp-Asp-Asp) domain-containing protein
MRKVLLAVAFFLCLAATASAEAENITKRMHVTGYRACDPSIRAVKQCNGITSSGRRVQWGLAACGRAYPFGTVFEVHGLGFFACYDRGGGVHNDLLDIYMPTGYFLPGGSRWRPVTVRYDMVGEDVLAGQYADSETAELFALTEEEEAPVAKVATRAGRSENLLGYAVADILRQWYRTDVALIHNGGLRADIAASALSVGNVASVLGKDQRGVRLDLKGEHVKKIVEYSLAHLDNGALWLNLSGIRLTYNPNAPVGQRIVSLVRDTGEPIWDGAFYKIILSDSLYLTSGFTAIFETGRGFETYEPVADTAAKWLTEQGLGAPPTEGRMTSTN